MREKPLIKYKASYTIFRGHMDIHSVMMYNFYSETLHNVLKFNMKKY